MKIPRFRFKLGSYLIHNNDQWDEVDCATLLCIHKHEPDHSRRVLFVGVQSETNKDMSILLHQGYERERELGQTNSTLRNQVADYQEAADSVRDLIRQLDVIWNGEAGASKQASLCDMVSQLGVEVPQLRAINAKLASALRQAQNALDKIGDPTETYCPTCNEELILGIGSGEFNDATREIEHVLNLYDTPKG